MRKIIRAIPALCLLILSLTSVCSATEDPTQRKNAIAIKLGAQVFSESDFTDFWGIDGNLVGPAFEIDYDRKLSRFLFVDVTLGYSTAENDSKDPKVDNAETNVRLSHLYLSPTLKAVAPLNQGVSLYGGIGPDLYYSGYDIDIAVATAKTRISDERFSIGGHALVGLEWLFYKKPVEDGYLDAPLGLIFEYKFAYVPFDDYDRKAIDVVNSGMGTSFSANDFDAGGHFFLIGLKWHF